MTYYSVSVDAAGVATDDGASAIVAALADRGGVVSTDGRTTRARFTIEAPTAQAAIADGIEVAGAAWRAARVRPRIVAAEIVTHAELDRRLART